jgi:hypothetical protein
VYRVVNAAEPFSASRDSEYLLQRLIEHWQSTAREAGRYALALVRLLEIKESQLVAFGNAKPQVWVSKATFRVNQPWSPDAAARHSGHKTASLLP